MRDTWVVLLEAASDDGAVAGMEASDAARLASRLDPAAPCGVLHCPGRYALQVTVSATGPAAALVDVLSRWSAAVQDLELPVWPVVRTEVLTPQELARDKAVIEALETTTGEEISDRHDYCDTGRELLRQALSDPLTGLIGREAATVRLEASLGSGEGRAAVVWIDIDDFARVNGQLGGHYADEILIAIALRLAAVLRRGDVLARFGADEFAALIAETTAEIAVTVAGRMLGAVREPITIGDRTVVLSASAGVAVSRAGDGGREVIENAEAALAAAKAGGGDGHVLFGAQVVGPSRGRRAFATGAVQDRLAHLLLTQRAAVAANEAETLHQAAQIVMAQLCTQLSYQLGYLWVSPAAEPSPDQIWHVADSGGYGALRCAMEALAVRPGVGPLGRVVATGRPVWMPELALERDFGPRVEAAAYGLRSAFAFPVLVGDEVAAALVLFSRARTDPTDAFLEVLASTGTQLGRVVERERAARAVREAGEQLQASERRLREAQAIAGLGSWTLEVGTGDVSWSEGMRLLFGLGPDEAVDLESPLGSVHPKDRERAGAALARLMEEGGRNREELRVVRRNGEIRWHHIEGSAVTDDNGRVVAIVGTSQDVTERKVAEEEIRSAKESYQRIVDMAHEGILTIDADDRTTFANPHMAKLLGYAVDEMMGMPVSAFVAPETDAALSGQRKRRRAGISEHYETQLRVKDGSTVHVLISASPLLDQDGQYSGALAMVTDITALRAAENIVGAKRVLL